MNYTYRVFEDNAGHYHLFAVTEGYTPIAGFETTDINDVIYTVKNTTTDPATEWDGQYGFDDDIDEEYDASRYDNYYDALKHHIRESVKEAYATLNEWVDARNGGAQELTIYRVLPEYQDLWTNDPGDCIVTRDEIERLAYEWGKTVEDLMNQVEEV